jgi:hypothetical protein
MSVTIDNEINRAAHFGQRLEDLVYNEAKEGRLVFRTKNDDLLAQHSLYVQIASRKGQASLQRSR